MNANKWTPGPWSLNWEATGAEVFAADGGTLMSMDRSADELNANAILIAAAPDLAEALRRIEEGCSFPEDDVQRACRDVARAALAKARGEE